MEIRAKYLYCEIAGGVCPRTSNKDTLIPACFSNNSRDKLCPIADSHARELANKYRVNVTTLTSVQQGRSKKISPLGEHDNKVVFILGTREKDKFVYVNGKKIGQ